MKFALFAIVLVCVPCGSLDAQTVYGPGGLFVHPTATAPARGTKANLSWFTQEAGGAESRWVPASITYSPDGRSEFGALFVSRRAGGRERASGGIFAKYQLRKGTVLSPSFAIVGSFLGGDVQQASLTAVGSYRIPATRGVMLHSGFQFARRSDLPVSQSDLSRFTALDVPLGRGVRLVAETGSRFKFDRMAATAYGIMWSSPGGVDLGIGFVNTGRSESKRLFIGAGYIIGGNR